MQQAPERPVYAQPRVCATMPFMRGALILARGLGLSFATVETNFVNIVSQLELAPAADDHRRVLAVLAHLRN